MSGFAGRFAGLFDPRPQMGAASGYNVGTRLGHSRRAGTCCNLLFNMNKFAPLVVLEDARPGRESATIFHRASAVLCADTPADAAPLLAKIGQALREGRHVAGYFAYEFGYLLEGRLAPLVWQKRSVPLAWFGVFESREELDAAACSGALEASGRAYAGRLNPEWNEEDYGERFAALKALIAAGDLYQANLTFRAHFDFAGDPRSLYRRLKQESRAGYCAYIDDGKRQILSLSPELFFEQSADATLRTRPMKGTAPRGHDAASDARARNHLVSSEKERAENLMIVDLLRNDLARVSETGSVTVEDLFAVETYPTLHQMVSTVTARRRPEVSSAQVIRALFPCGSVTGAPKIRAMEVIRALETSPRGVYCGAIGAFAPDGAARFNVAIRTLTIKGNRGELGVGGAVVFDSQSESEYRECLLKARYFEAARVPMGLIETLRWSPTEGFVRGDRHLERMEHSAAVFGIRFSRDEASRRMRDAVADCHMSVRLRVLLSEAGAIDLTATEIEMPAATEWRYAISTETVHSADLLLQYKTNQREMFDAEHARALAAGADEILFLNERGEVTEGSRTNVFIEHDGALFTPAKSCGLLPGCLRGELIESGRCREALIVPADLARADAVWLGNSLRGLVPAVPLATAGG